MRKTLLLFGLLAMTACGSAREVAMPSGPVFPLNPGRWTPGAEDLGSPPEIIR